MSDLANGDTSVEVFDTDRKDEIGTIARGLVVVRDAVKQNNQLMAAVVGASRR